ncbi:hypothetical protein CSAL01_09705 [Colletotrichum salicis]|uniref:Uncharacterized protein n=1 Tax=Colletotrichum salicis TaxID=1209931 RepID=A0A135UY00_9PEZI|nr:hypothetical protein CSAL01_09705 [Colletotrichum salicis]
MSSTTEPVSISLLLSVTLQFLSFLVQDSSRKVSKELIPPSYRRQSPMSASGDEDEDEDHKIYCNTGNHLDGSKGRVSIDATYPAFSEDQTSSNGDLARFMLNEERDRLCLWQSTFSEEELDRLLHNPTGSALYAFGMGVRSPCYGSLRPFSSTEYQIRKNLEDVVYSGKQTVQITLQGTPDMLTMNIECPENFSTASSIMASAHTNRMAIFNLYWSQTLECCTDWVTRSDKSSQRLLHWPTVKGLEYDVLINRDIGAEA